MTVLVGGELELRSAWSPAWHDGELGAVGARVDDALGAVTGADQRTLVVHRLAGVDHERRCSAGRGIGAGGDVSCIGSPFWVSVVPARSPCGAGPHEVDLDVARVGGVDLAQDERRVGLRLPRRRHGGEREDARTATRASAIVERARDGAALATHRLAREAVGLEDLWAEADAEVGELLGELGAHARWP